MSSLSSAVAPPAARQPLRLAHLGDELLARQAARGSERAFAALYERYHQPLYRYCRSILRNDPDAQDALQSTFAGALQALRRNHRDAPLRPWLYRIAHNESISLLRRRKRDSADQLEPESMGIGSSTEQVAADRARWRNLVADLGSLPDRQRGALLLRELSGLSHDEIAIAIGTSTAAAKQAIFEARQALAELEEGRSMSCQDVRRRISEGDRRVLRGRRVNAHLRDCAACEAFSLAIGERRTQLRAMTPALPPALAAAVLARSIHAASTQGAAAGGASTAVTAGVGAAGKVAGTALVWKTIAGVAVVATAAAGGAGIGHLLTTHPATAPPISAPAAPSHTMSSSSTITRHGVIKPSAVRDRAATHVVNVSHPAVRHHALRTQQPDTASGHAQRAAQVSSAHGQGQGHAPASPGHSASGPSHTARPAGRSSPVSRRSSVSHSSRGTASRSDTHHSGPVIHPTRTVARATRAVKRAAKAAAQPVQARAASAGPPPHSH